MDLQGVRGDGLDRLALCLHVEMILDFGIGSGGHCMCCESVCVYIVISPYSGRHAGMGQCLLQEN